MNPRSYVYLKEDEILGTPIRYYYEFLSRAKEQGRPCFAAWIEDLYRNCGSASGVARVLGVDYKTVLRWVRRMGLPVRKRGGVHPRQLKEKKQ
jgi:transposase